MLPDGRFQLREVEGVVPQLTMACHSTTGRTELKSLLDSRLRCSLFHVCHNTSASPIWTVTQHVTALILIAISLQGLHCSSELRTVPPPLQPVYFCPYQLYNIFQFYNPVFFPVSHQLRSCSCCFNVPGLAPLVSSGIAELVQPQYSITEHIHKSESIFSPPAHACSQRTIIDSSASNSKSAMFSCPVSCVMDSLDLYSGEICKLCCKVNWTNNQT